MKKCFITACMIVCFVVAAGAAMADDIKGRIGVTGRIGFLVPADSELVAPDRNLDTDIGFIGGGGFIYGINKNFAVELDITHTEFDTDLGSSKLGDFETNNVSLGAQYRFADLPTRQLVPYLGAGLDILMSDFTDTAGNKLDVDTVAGVHVSAGVDYFVMKQLALTTEVKGILAPDSDIDFSGGKVGNFDPTSLSMTFGVRYFFN